MPAGPGNSLNISQAGIVTFDGAHTFTGSGITQHDILVGGATNGITSVAPSATSGVPVISQGAAADPTFGTAVVAGGGTGQTTLTNHGVLIGAGTSAITQSSVGATGTVLAGNTGADPTFQTLSTLGGSLVLIQSQTASSSATLDFTTGTSTYTSHLFIFSSIVPATAGASLRLQNSGNGGSTWNSAATYSSGLTYNLFNSVLTTNANSSTFMTLSGAATTNANGMSGYLLLTDCNSVDTVKIHGEMNWLDNGTTTPAVGFLGGNNASFTNAFRILFSSGNIASGTITLYGLKTS